MAWGWLRRGRNDIFPNSAADGAPSNCQKRGDFHLLVTRGRFKLVTYKQRALQRFPQPQRNPTAALPARLHLGSHLGCQRDGEPRLHCSAWGLISLSGPLGFLALHVLEAFISMGFAGTSGRSSPPGREVKTRRRSQPWTRAASDLGETPLIACCCLFFRGIGEGRGGPEEEPCAWVQCCPWVWPPPAWVLCALTILPYSGLLPAAVLPATAGVKAGAW